MHNERGARVRRWSGLAFVVLVVLHTIAVIAFGWFPTLDGPAHVYNARIIAELLSGDVFVGRFFGVNPFPEPNWLGHAIMAGTLFIAPAQIAERVLMLLYVVGLPLAFRFALRRLGARTDWPALLVFPFIYCFTFRIGFLNFSLGFPLLLVAIGLGRSFAQHTGRKGWVLALVLLALYFAHLTCFLLAFALLIAQPIWNAIIDQRAPLVPRLRAVVPALRGLLVCAAPALLLSAAFFVSHHDARASLSRLPSTELLHWLINGRPFVALGPNEEPFARAFAWLMAGLTVAVFIARPWRSDELFKRNMFWLVAALALIVAFFVLPDQMATGGVVSVRLLLFAYLLWAIWLGVQLHKPAVLAVALATYMAADLLALRVHVQNTRSLNAELSELLSVAGAVPEHAVVLPLNYSGNWLHSNFHCYLGAVRNAIVLDNFCARTPHMPVRWCDGAEPGDAVGNFTTSDRPCVHLGAYVLEGDAMVDHVLTWKLNDAMTDSCTMDVRRQLAVDFVPVAVSPNGDARLYRRR